MKIDNAILALAVIIDHTENSGKNGFYSYFEKENEYDFGDGFEIFELGLVINKVFIDEVRNSEYHYRQFIPKGFSLIRCSRCNKYINPNGTDTYLLKSEGRVRPVVHLGCLKEGEKVWNF